MITDNLFWSKKKVEKNNVLVTQNKLSVILTFDLVIKDRQKRLDIAAIFNHNEVEEISHKMIMIMAIWVVEFSNGEYKIRKICA